MRLSRKKTLYKKIKCENLSLQDYVRFIDNLYPDLRFGISFYRICDIYIFKYDICCHKE